MGKKKKDKSKPGELLVCSLPRAHQRYDIEERLEAGMVLVGSEVKASVDEGRTAMRSYQDEARAEVEASARRRRIRSVS